MIWLTQAQIVKLFESSKANISEHTKHIFAAGELDIDQTVRKFRTVKTEGKKQVSVIKRALHCNTLPAAVGVA